MPCRCAALTPPPLGPPRLLLAAAGGLAVVLLSVLSECLWTVRHAAGVRAGPTARALGDRTCCCDKSLAVRFGCLKLGPRLTESNIDCVILAESSIVIIAFAVGARGRPSRLSVTAEAEASL